MIDPYELLAEAIIVQAADDYRQALKDLKLNPNYAPALTDKSEIESFFQSAWYRRLTKVNGQMILRLIKQEEEYNG